ncbi:MAG: hypothetical protein ACC612_13705 [Methanomethylovorans sp.]|uniref:hypothetical protein n=1 Tax=Methanomethylovorans sp. TaxID=2758717 RepID=UPI0035312795
MKQMVKITNIDVLSLAKILGLLYAFFGLILGLLMSLFMVVPSSMMGYAGGVSGLLMGLGVIITVPIFYGIMGFISGIIMAIPYNIIANWIGGLEVEVETKE